MKERVDKSMGIVILKAEAWLTSYQQSSEQQKQTNKKMIVIKTVFFIRVVGRIHCVFFWTEQYIYTYILFSN
jgi:hypothetical protein